MYTIFLFIFLPQNSQIGTHIAKLSPVQNIAQFKSCSQFLQSYFNTNKTSFM